MEWVLAVVRLGKGKSMQAVPQKRLAQIPITE